VEHGPTVVNGRHTSFASPALMTRLGGFTHVQDTLIALTVVRGLRRRADLSTHLGVARSASNPGVV
jgi:hypothetical protein